MNIKYIAIGAIAFAIAVIGGTSIYTFNVSALAPHWGITTSILEGVRVFSIHSRVDEVPDTELDLSNEELITKGAMQYEEMCAQCHLGPGLKETEIHQGLYPTPPKLHAMDHAPHDPRETFWVIRNGIKMTGMPAWGPTHDDETIWSMVAFVQKLNGMSEADYKEYLDKAHKMGIPHTHN